MANLITRNSTTPTVNVDDFTEISRHSFQNRNGILKNVGNECALSSSAGFINISSGEIIYQGYLTSVNTGGEQIAIQNTTDLRNYILYLEIDLRTPTNQTATFKVVSSLLPLFPTIDAGDDLTVNKNGLARFTIGSFQAQNNIITNILTIANVVDYPVNFYYNTNNNVNILNTNNINQNETTPFVIPTLQLLSETAQSVTFANTINTVQFQFITYSNIAQNTNYLLIFFEVLDTAITQARSYVRLIKADYGELFEKTDQGRQEIPDGAEFSIIPVIDNNNIEFRILFNTFRQANYRLTITKIYRVGI